MAYRDATLCVKSTNICGREAKEIVGPCQAQENRFLVLFITSYSAQANNICLDAVNIMSVFSQLPLAIYNPFFDVWYNNSRSLF